MEGYSELTKICINTIFSVSLALFCFLFYVICKHSPATLGGYKYLLLSNLILSNICNFMVFLFKPIFWVNCDGIIIQATGFGKQIPKSMETSYFYLEASALALLLLAFSIFVSIFYRYQQMLPPSTGYWLNGIKILKKISWIIFVAFVIPNFLLLRFSRIDQKMAEKENGIILTSSTLLMNDYQSYDGHQQHQQQHLDLIVIYSGKLNFFFYLFLIWSAISLLVLFIFFALFHANIYHAMNETFQRYLEETYRGQKLVFTVFSIQMASYIALFILPITIAALSAINWISLPSKGYEILIILITSHTVFDAISVLYFIKAYRHFTFQLIFKFLRYKNSKNNYSKEYSWETSMKVLNNGQ